MERTEKMLNFLIFILFGIGFASYIIAALKRTVPLPKSTWLIWFVINWITVQGLIAVNQLNTLAVTAAIGASVVLVLSLFKGEPGWTGMDTFCSLGAAAGVAVWLIYRSPTVGIVVVQIVAFIGSLSTVKVAWKGKERGRYAWTTWSSFLLASILMFFGLPELTLTNIMQPSNFALSIFLILLGMAVSMPKKTA